VLVARFLGCGEVGIHQRMPGASSLTVNGPPTPCRSLAPRSLSSDRKK
jgi:hypothetical protein